MSRKQSSAQLFLMEFICVAAFFALCAALCLNAFVKADNMSRDGRALNQALLTAQSMAETIKGMEDPSSSAIAQAAEEISTATAGRFMVGVQEQTTDQLLEAEITIYEGADEKQEVCTLSVSRYLSGEVRHGE
ncbi:hypothetical protein Ami103574_03845 [Aminipila butyrica]|uniref:Uncharacterized protein n=1 Tax=Aminipila butyrica TaxID=433296 RepID=A0A858BT15_9FIRM|nr:hypothetical protein [Aminipila butyrica]QIB68502.1 hypothetical protein Ami103574_03845 [Aminipila butyrica]